MTTGSGTGSTAFVKRYTYDDLDRLTSVKYNGTETARYAYNAEGALSLVRDYEAENSTRYVYDLAGRLAGVRLTSGTGNTPGTLTGRLDYAYEARTNRFGSYSVVTPLGSSYRLGKTQFLYGQSGRSDRVDAVYYGQSTISSADQSASPSMKQVLHYSYDELNRRTMRQLKMQDGTWYNTTYSYEEDEDNPNKTTIRLKTLKNGSDRELEYYYDANGNITYIYDSLQCLHEYIYNEQNWLMQDNDYKNNRTYVYLYDSNGNIENVTEYGSAGTTSGTPLSTIYYGYNGLEDDERWDDVLTWYDDTEITYDSFHNPKNWRDGMNLSWQNGSQLYIVSQSSGNSSYYYDASGARYQKISKGVTTTYHLVDGVAYSEKRSNGIELQYLYDENGSVYGIRKNGILYYFLFNGQGDVIGIYDEYKTLQARYEYDAWGKLLSVTNASGATITSSTHIGNVNPFRYRGYYYDVETGFYYLNSRYYDPEVKRFLTADSMFDTGAGTLAFNLYAYCANNPVNMFDPGGEFAISIASLFLGAVIVVACAAMLAVVNTPSFQRSWERMCNGLAGTFSGALSWAAAQAESIAQSIGDSFAKTRTKPQYRTPREVHHIVAKAAPNASQARKVLNAVGIGVNSPQNLIPIKTGLHRRLHTNTYYGWANSVIISAYNRGRNQNEKRRNVEAALASIRAMIMAMDAVAPY